MDKISELKSAKDTNDLEKIKSSSESLNASMMKIGEAMKTTNDSAADGANTQSEPAQETPASDSEAKPEEGGEAK